MFSSLPCIGATGAVPSPLPVRAGPLPDGGFEGPRRQE